MIYSYWQHYFSPDTIWSSSYHNEVHIPTMWKWGYVKLVKHHNYIITFKTPFSFNMTLERPSSITSMMKLKVRCLLQSWPRPAPHQTFNFLIRARYNTLQSNKWIELNGETRVPRVPTAPTAAPTPFSTVRYYKVINIEHAAFFSWNTVQTESITWNGVNMNVHLQVNSESYYSSVT
jgi:hypothetical protein